MASVMLHEEEGDLESKMALTAAVMAEITAVTNGL